MWIQFILSAILGLFAELCYLMTSYLLDGTGIFSAAVSNFLGLMVDVILDFILQSRLFMGKTIFGGLIVGKFVIFRIIDTSVRQSLFVIGMQIPAIKKYIKNQKPLSKKSRIPQFLWHRTTHVRYLATLICFFIITFPLRKYFVFTAPARI
ncbi:hypothetical protein [uncultured Mediterranean phage]|nr:hypothetical protein [uncultured Mediterranean phage]